MRQRYFILGLLVIAGAALFFLRKNSPVPLPPPAPEDVSASAALPEDDVFFAPKAVEAEPVAVSEPAAVSEIKKCFQKNEILSDFLKSDVLQFQNLKKLSGAKLVTYEQINVHYTADGRSLRLSLLNEKGEGEKDNVRLFLVDSDGLPTRLALPEAWTGLSHLDIFRDIREQHTIARMQKKTFWQLDSGIHFKLSEDNSQIQDVMVFFKDDKNQNITLGCHRGDGTAGDPVTSCKCMSPIPPKRR